MVIEFLEMLVLILIGTKIAAHFCSKLGIPTVVGELAVGVLLGPAILNWIQPTASIHLFSEIGVILLMFLAGLESDFSLLRKYLKPSLLVALLGIIFPMLFVYLISTFLFQLTLLQSLFLGLIFSATSVSISVQVLREYRRVDSQEGAVILGAAVVDDIVVVLLLSIFTTLFAKNQSTVIDFKFFWNLLGTKILFFVGMYLFAKYLLEPIIKIAQKLLVSRAEMTVSLVLCFVFAVLSEMLGMSDVMGAFFIGLMLSNKPVKKEIEKNTDVIASTLFVPVFFVSIGLSVDLGVIQSEFLFVVILTIVALASKMFGGYLGARVNQIGSNPALIVGAGMISRGEMALIIAQIGISLAFIDDTLFSISIIVVILTTLCSPLLMKYYIGKQEKN